MNIDYSISIANIISFLLIIIAIIGWWIDRAKQRHIERYKKALEKRLSMLDSIIEVYKIIEDTNGAPFTNANFHLLLKETRRSVLLYGNIEEIKSFEFFVKSLEDKNINDANSSLRKVINTSRQNIRKELGIKRVPLTI